MAGMEIVYTANEVYGRLGVSSSTLRKYSDVLEREGYEVRKNSRGRRDYTEFDVVFRQPLVELSKEDGMTLEKAAKLIVKEYGIVNKKEETEEANPMPYHVQYQLHQQYSAMVAELNRVQQANLLEMENRLSDYMDQRNTLMEEDMRNRKEHEGRLEKRLERRDVNLMKMIREI
ncbi:TPA: MerR family transcriptional regulator [Bacillus mycoides]|uniref:MerR family transcriptional regulator n=1 Tax=Bacillus TaxID=1386 RepID=UPI002E22C578|nr:MerR family transcriptional regulator [Bacillus mycoides]MED0945943.1 MerR family transcriptional regulator [Bacillus mycoides]HDR7598939.1 MerR family transcriptional regulator [Bacillus mycoides]